MALRRTTLIDPPIEALLDKVDSKFTLVSLSAKRARQINSYYNQLGDGMGMVVPPQVASVSGKPLTIAFEEIAAAKATYHHPEPGGEGAEGEEAAGAEAAGDAGIDAALTTVEGSAASAVDGAAAGPAEGTAPSGTEGESAEGADPQVSADATGAPAEGQ